MAYCIMRFEKHKTASIASLAGSLVHTMRSRYTPNADPELTKNNRVWLGPKSTKEVAQAIREKWPAKFRKDAIGCLEYFIGASPEWFKKHGGQGDQDAYFQRAIDWLKGEYGEENVISVVQHNDETSPHLAAYVVPRDTETGRLNAKRWTGGRAACAQMQTRFQEFAGEPVGLERGVRFSNAKHTTIRQWYAAQADLDERAKEIELARWRGENKVLWRETDVEQKEKNIALRESEIASKQREIEGQAEVLAKRENRLQEQIEALERQKTEIAKAAAQLTAAAERFEGQKAAWLSASRPVVPPLVQHLQHLEKLGVNDSAEYLELQNSDELYELFDPLDGPTERARALLDRYSSVSQQAEQFDQAFTPGSTPGL
tara:strand:- start:1333 stop:2451 length:1119 start_codon:yes stop_codon:yes gene_type:complete